MRAAELVLVLRQGQHSRRATLAGAPARGADELPGGPGLAQPQLARLALVLHRGGDRHLPRQGRGRHRDRGPDRRRPSARTPDPPRTSAGSSAGRRRPGMAGDPGGTRSFGARPNDWFPIPPNVGPYPASSPSTKKTPGSSLAGSRRSPSIWVSSTPCADRTARRCW
jgi:hypothetical protein